MNTADSIRKEKKNLRDSLSDADWRRKSAAICDRVVDMAVYKQAKTIMSYISIGREADTRQLISTALADGKQVAVPKTGDDHELTFFKIDSPDQVKPGRFSVPEPVDTDEHLIVTLDEDTLMIIPGLAFDQRGYRLGYGAGYYDRYLEQDTYRNKLMLAFSFQEVSEVPIHDGDIPVNWIATEQQIIEIN